MKTENRFLEKLKEKRINDKAIIEEEGSSTALGLTIANSTIQRIKFKLCSVEFIPAFMFHGDDMIRHHWELDEEDIEYFRKKFSTEKAIKEAEYNRKLNALNREYGKE